MQNDAPNYPRQFIDVLARRRTLFGIDISKLRAMHMGGNDKI